MICIDDNGTCGLGGFCRQCPNLKGESMTDKATVKDLELWAKESKSPLVSEGYLMAAKTITHQQELLSNCKVKIIQIMCAPEDCKYQGAFLGLGDDGVVYVANGNGEWEVYLPLKFKEVIK